MKKNPPPLRHLGFNPSRPARSLAALATWPIIIIIIITIILLLYCRIEREILYPGPGLETGPLALRNSALTTMQIHDSTTSKQKTFL